MGEKQSYTFSFTFQIHNAITDALVVIKEIKFTKGNFKKHSSLLVTVLFRVGNKNKKRIFCKKHS